MAQHKKNAETLINYYYDPKVMAQVVDYVNYISVVKGTKEILEKLDPDGVREPADLPRRPRRCRGRTSSAA